MSLLDGKPLYYIDTEINIIIIIIIIRQLPEMPEMPTALYMLKNLPKRNAVLAG